MDLHLSTRQVGTRALVSVRGEVDLESAQLLGDHALTAVRDICADLVLDLSEVTFMDSTGLKVILAVQRRSQLAGGSTVLTGCTRPVRRILSITGLDQVIPCFDHIGDLDTPRDIDTAGDADQAPVTPV